MKKPRTLAQLKAHPWVSGFDEEFDNGYWLYLKDGYRQVFTTDDATALRLQPSEPSIFSGLPGPLSALGPENEKLLKEVSSPTFTMSKVLK